jgi:hypothetical protein
MIVVLPFGHLDPGLLQQLAALTIPLGRGMAIVATHISHDVAILDILRIARAFARRPAERSPTSS